MLVKSATLGLLGWGAASDMAEQTLGRTGFQASGRRSSFFPIASLLLLVLTIAGFSDNLFTDVGQPSNSDPKFIVHGLFCGSWMIALLAQSLLVSRSNVRLHRKLGMFACVAAIGVTLSTIWVFVVVWKGWALMTPEVRANRLLLPSYAMFVGLGYRFRRSPERHKRFMYTGTLFMLEPILARAYDPLLVPFMTGLTEAQIDAVFLPTLFGVWVSFFLALFAYDLAHARRIHAVSVGALFWFASIWAIVLAT